MEFRSLWKREGCLSVESVNSSLPGGEGRGLEPEGGGTIDLVGGAGLDQNSV